MIYFKDIVPNQTTFQIHSMEKPGLIRFIKRTNKPYYNTTVYYSLMKNDGTWTTYTNHMKTNHEVILNNIIKS